MSDAKQPKPKEWEDERMAECSWADWPHADEVRDNAYARGLQDANACMLDAIGNLPAREVSDKTRTYQAALMREAAAKIETLMGSGYSLPQCMKTQEEWYARCREVVSELKERGKG